MQAAATVSGQSVSANKGLYTFVGKEKLGFTRLEHGTGDRGDVRARLLRGGFDVQRHGDRRYVTDGVLECVNVRGTFVPGEEIAASAIKATLQGIAASPMWCSRTRPARRPSATVRASTTISRPHRVAARPRILLRRHGVPDRRLRVFRRTAVDALTASDVTGELLFVGQPDQGPGLVVQCWKVTLSLSGEVGLISEELASIPMTGEVLADDLNHPESPFFRVRYLG